MEPLVPLELVLPRTPYRRLLSGMEWRPQPAAPRWGRFVARWAGGGHRKLHERHKKTPPAWQPAAFQPREGLAKSRTFIRLNGQRKGSGGGALASAGPQLGRQRHLAGS